MKKAEVFLGLLHVGRKLASGVVGMRAQLASTNSWETRLWALRVKQRRRELLGA
jgi:hypothetical protein